MPLTSFHRAQPALEFIPPDFDPRVLAVTQGLLPLWMRWQVKLVDVEVEQAEILAQLYDQFQRQQVRFLIAFRHPSPDDPYCLARLLWSAVPKAARQTGLSLRSPLHAHFIYDRGIPLWAGRWIGWLYAKLGGTPIQRGKVDRQGLRSARHLFAHGTLPLAAAPEGGNNGHTEIVSPLEPGVAQLSFWCVEDLQRANRPERVVILPLGIAYHYVAPPWKPLEVLLQELETVCGLQQPSAAQVGETPISRLYPRLYRLGEHLLVTMEDYYRNYYGCQLKAEGSLDQRLSNLLDQALSVAESYFQMAPRGSVIDRCRRIEQAGWERIFRDELRNRRDLPALQRGLADRIAEEAQLRMWHMRLVENFVAVTGRYVRSHPSAERFAETLMLVRDTIAFIQGKNPFPRPKLGAQKARLRVGEPIEVSDRWSAYQAGRKAAVEELTQDLQRSLEALI
ncbi:glycerol acyltransferase [filamentous cyanobacterium CCP5]|nr:glycerol acyltransferase [filamentous cyanobacterium CCP5]